MTRRRWLLALGAVLVAAAVGVAIGLLVWERSDSPSQEATLIPEGAEEIRQRERWFYEQRTTVGEPVPASAFVVARRAAARARGAAGAEALRWTELGPAAIGVGGPEPNDDLDWPPGGPTPYSGRITSIANHPTQAATAYIGTSGGGVWKTTDDGQTWTPLFDRQPSLSIGAVAVDPNAPETVYAGTGEGNLIGTPSYFGAGLFRSTNGGSEWTKIGGSSFDECHISAIGLKTGVILVAAHGFGANRWEGWRDRCKDRQGLWLSDDGGNSFRRVIEGGLPVDLASSPRDPAVWYAAFVGARIYKSTDSGRTWRKLELRTTTPTGTVEVVDGARIDIDVARSASGPVDVVYAAVATLGDQLRGVFRSQDGGDTWEKLNPTVVPREAELDFADACDRQCNYNLVIAADPKDPSRAYFGGTFFNRYDGNVASVILWGDVHMDFHALTFDASGRLWIGTDGGIWRSDDGGETADNLNAGIGTALIYPGIAGSASGPLYAGMQDNGTARYRGSPSWQFVFGGDGFFNAVDPANPLPAYVTVYFLQIIKLTAAGTCLYEDAGLTDARKDTTAPFNAPLVMHPTERGVMYAGTSRIWKTTNADSTECGATRWTLDSQDFSSWVTAIGPAPSDSQVVYAATEPRTTTGEPTTPGLYVRRPGSTTWVNTQGNGLPADRHFTDIAVHPTDPATAWVTVSGFVDGAHIFGTTNYGQTWIDLDNGLPNVPANAAVVDTRGARPVLYVGTDVGVYASDNGGSSWTNVGGNLPNAAVMDLLLDTSSSQPTLVAATFGRGAWSAPLA